MLEPATPFLQGLHVEAICQHLQAVTEGRIGNLIINVPPGHAKSLLTAVFWPAWVWIANPQTRWLFASYSAQLSVRDSLKCRRLIESDWYQQRWGHRYQLTSDQNQKHRFENDHTGYRIATSVGGSATGERADVVVVDDPHSVDQAESDAERRTAVEWFNGTMSTRLNDFTRGHKVVIQQRLHEADLTGDLLVKGDFELLCLPAEFEPERRCTTSIGWTDPRVQCGELLWPDKVTAAHLERSEGLFGSLPLCRTVSAAAGSGRRWHFPTGVVALLAAGTHGLAVRAGAPARWTGAPHSSRAGAGGVRHHDSILGHGLQGQRQQRLRGRASVGRQGRRPLPAGSGPRPHGYARHQGGRRAHCPNAGPRRAPSWWRTRPMARP